jgi:hypothetical protein
VNKALRDTPMITCETMASAMNLVRRAPTGSVSRPALSRLYGVERTPSVIVQHRYVQDSNQPGSVRRFACMHFPGAW